MNLSCLHKKVQRCMLLINFIKTDGQQRNDNLFFSNSTAHLHIINVECNIVNMRKYLMTDEPSVKRYKKCLSGHQTVEEVPVLNINGNIIKEDGFKAVSPERGIFRPPPRSHLRETHANVACQCVGSETRCGHQLRVKPTVHEDGLRYNA